MERATVIFPIQNDAMLLGIKADKVAKGLRNGPGGKIEDGEIPSVSACRELVEEVGLVCKPEDLVPHAVIEFFFGNSTEPEWRVIFYTTRIFTGTPFGTKEMLDPQWFQLNSIEEVYISMMPADKFILRKILKNDKFTGWVRFNDDKTVAHKFEEVDESLLVI